MQRMHREGSGGVQCGHRESPSVAQHSVSRPDGALVLQKCIMTQKLHTRLNVITSYVCLGWLKQ